MKLKTPHIQIVVLFLLTTICPFGLQGQDLFINEVLAGNSATNFDDFLDYDDWIEIYRPAGTSPAVLNLAGYYLSDNRGNLTKWEIPDDDAALTTIVSGQHLLFWCDQDTTQGADHVGFKLSTDGEKVYLTEPDGLTVIDSIWFGDQVADISLGRECDGCEEWIYFNTPTPDDDNVTAAEPPAVLFINEVMSINSGYFDDPDDEFDPWVEIYNPNTFQVNLAGYHLSAESDPLAFQFGFDDPTDTYIAPGGFRLVWFDNQPEQGLHHTTQVLPAMGTLTLSASDGTLVDEVTYDASTPETSYGRQSDGSSAWITFLEPTPRVTNSIIFIEPEELYINEFMPDNDSDTTDTAGGNADWIEIYNPNDYPVNLAGYYLSDNEEIPNKWQITINFPELTTIEPGGFLLFWADESGSQGWNHTNFRLKDSGEDIGLYSPDGWTPADEYSWGEYTIPGDVSVGRLTDGGLPWVWFSDTTPEYSNNGSVTGVEESALAQLLVYPNPVSHETIRFSEQVTGWVLDLNGRRVMEVKQAERLDVSALDAGSYLLRDQGGRTVRFLKL